MSSENRLVALKPPQDEAMKPSELIRIDGHQNLSLNARRAITVLWHNAHQQGISAGKDYVIDLDRLRSPGHKGFERVEEAVVSLMQTILTVKIGDKTTRRVQFLGGNDLHDPDRPSGTLTYSFDKRLVGILEDSKVWGRIALPVLMAFSSKYAVSLYENCCQLSGLQHKFYQDFELEVFRSLIGVEDEKYKHFGGLNKHVLKPACAEINALAPFNIMAAPLKTGKRVTHVRISWWRKNEDELRAAWAESQRPKVGRRARIEGRAEVIEPISSRSPKTSLLED